jgi:hypothetical protein
MEEIMKKRIETRNLVHITAQRCGAGKHKNKKDVQAKQRRQTIKNKDEPFWSSLFSLMH